MQTENKKVLTVTQLNDYVKMLLENSPVLNNVFVCGEISNFTNHYRTGHLYFTLKDENAAVKAVMFRSSAEKLRFAVSDGMKVTVSGRVSSFVRDGVYQIYVGSMEPYGVGSLYIAFEQLKRRLEAEGLFDAAKKKSLPRYPARVGIITSQNGAALQDMLNISKRRFPLAEILIYPALVQGDGAVRTLTAGIRYFESRSDVDVVIIGRGGGSLEDLWAFNSETLAYEIARCEIPVVSAVGHETDYTICDFVSDLRAPTPSAAAELVFPDSEELRFALMTDFIKMRTAVESMVQSKKNTVAQLAKSNVLASYGSVFNMKRYAVSAQYELLKRETGMALMRHRALLEKNAASLNALSPLSLLSKGYSVIMKTGSVVKSASELKTGERVRLLLRDGEATADITEVSEKNTGCFAGKDFENEAYK